MRFDGKTFEMEKDGSRLATQFLRVLNLMWDGDWRTLAQIAAATGGSEAGVSARLRDLRKARFGRMKVERVRLFGGLFVYKLGTKKKKPGAWKRSIKCQDCGEVLRWYEIMRWEKFKLCKGCVERAKKL